MHALLKRALAHAALLALAGALVVPVHPALASQVSCNFSPVNDWPNSS